MKSELRVSLGLLALTAGLMAVLWLVNCCSGGEETNWMDMGVDGGGGAEDLREKLDGTEMGTCVVQGEPCSFRLDECVWVSTGGCFQCTCAPGGWALMFAGCVDKAVAEWPLCGTWVYRLPSGDLCKLGEHPTCSDGGEGWLPLPADSGGQ